MRIRIICVGKIKQEFSQTQEHYLNLLKPHISVEVVEIKEGKNVKEEGEKIEKAIKGVAFLLDEKGHELNSVEFAEVVKNALIKDGVLSFIIGGKNGVDERIKEFCEKTISLSKLTFSHQLARIVLLEQIYRSVSIIKNLPFSR